MEKKITFAPRAWSFSSAATHARAPASPSVSLAVHLSGDLLLTRLLGPSLQGDRIQLLIPESIFQE
jgi:hypothetical protein